MIKNIIISLCVMQLFYIVGGQVFKGGGVSCNDVKLIVNTHNNWRRAVANGTLQGQPKASNMQTIVWDDNLQYLAQNWANNMNYKHNSRRSDGRWENVGENLFVSWNSDKRKGETNWKRALAAWFDENEIYDYGKFNGDGEIGHYTQFVWADTIYVGCGFSKYIKNNFLYKLYVCNYGPSGNYIGEYPYKRGAGCEKLCCGNQCRRRYGRKC